MELSTEQEIKAFLSRVKEVMHKINGFHLIERKKNLDSLDKHGLSIDIAELYIENLTVEDYLKGPEQDDQEQYDHCWWFFAKKIGTPFFYIKIRIEDRGREQVVCLSFHEAKYNLDFPYEKK